MWNRFLLAQSRPSETDPSVTLRFDVMDCNVGRASRLEPGRDVKTGSSAELAA
jgi:hypothetical protein